MATHPEQDDETGDGSQAPARTLGPYRILGELGRGGMGIVYRAQDPALKRTVALKVMIEGRDAPQDALARFQREAEAVARLGHHPNIVPVYDVGREIPAGGGGAALHYIAMHFVQGVPLDRLLDEGPLPPRRAAEIARRIAGALAHAHEHGILHRDVKPANILLALPEGERGRGGEAEHASPPRPLPSSPPRAEGTHGVPMLTDFGLAKDVSSETRVTATGVVVGTPQYMSPEQADGRHDDVDERSDVWGLGAVLYEMLNGAPPFDGETPLKVLRNVLTRDPAPLRRLRPRLPRDLETVCLACLDKDPARRYPGARALAEDLDRFLAGEAVRARPVGPGTRAWRGLRRHKAVAAVASVALALLAAVVIAGAVWIRDESRRRSQTQAQANAAQALAGKRERVSKLLLGAYGILGDAQDRLRRRARRAGLSKEQRDADLAEALAALDAFAADQGEDGASRAVLSAVRGWLEWLGGRPTEATARFAAGRAADPDVAWCDLFEALTLLSGYLSEQAMPAIVVRETETLFGEIPPETELLRGKRRRFEALVSAAAGKPIGGEEASAVGAVLSAFLGIRSRDLEAVDAGLTRALNFWAMAWMKPDLYHARAKLRYFGRDPAAALPDAQAYLSSVPESAAAHDFVGFLLAARAQELHAAGQDPFALRAQALEAFDRALALDPDCVTARNDRGILLMTLSLDPAGGQERVEELRRALADFDEAVRLGAGASVALNNRALARIHMARLEEAVGLDPRPTYALAEKDLSALLALDPVNGAVLRNRGAARLNHGLAERDRGGDPEPLWEAALGDLDRALAADASDRGARLNRGRILVNLGEQASARGEDPASFLDRALADAEAVLATGRDDAQAHLVRGLARGAKGRWETLHGRDAQALLEGSIRDFDACAGAGGASDPGAFHFKAAACLRLAEFLQARGRDPMAALDAGVEACTRALGLVPGKAAFLSLRAGLVLKRGETRLFRRLDPRDDYKSAIEDATAALASNPHDLNARVHRGNGYRCLGDAEGMYGGDPRDLYGKGLEDLEAAERGRPGDFGVLVSRINLLMGLGRARAARGEDPRPQFRAAVEDADRLLSSRPAVAGLHSNRAMALQGLGEAERAAGGDGGRWFEAALESFDLAVRHDPHFWRAFIGKGALLESLCRYEEAAQAYEEAYRIAGDSLKDLKGWIEAARAKARAAEGK